MQKAVYGEEIFDYLVYVPKDFNLQENYPLLIFLHGAGERGDDLNVLKVHSVPKICDDENVSHRAIIVSPQCKSDRTWTSQTEKLRAFIDEIVKKYPVDVNAISLTGVSMGGFGTWQMIMDYPSLFSAAAPICGGGMAWRVYDTILNLPLRIFHGEADDAVDVFYSKDMYRALKKYNAKNAELFLYPGVGHDVWNIAYEKTELIKWLISQKKNTREE